MKLGLSKEQKDALLKKLIYAPCVHCGGAHDRACPRTKTMKFGSDGKTLTEVEFWPDRKWNPWPRSWPWDRGPRNGVLYLADILEEGDELPAMTDEERLLEEHGMNPLLTLLRGYAETQALRARALARTRPTERKT